MEESKGFDENQANLYSAILSVGLIYTVILIYATTYFFEDFRAVFCPKRVDQSKKND